MQNYPFNWDQVRESLRTSLGTEVVDRWLAPLRLAGSTEQTILLEAPNPFFRDWVSSHYLEALCSHANGRSIEITISADVAVMKSPTGVPSRLAGVGSDAMPDQPPPSAGAGELRLTTVWGRALNNKFSFDRFVVGPSNRFAHAASLAVAQTPAKAYNPLFIYGGVGLGKTHLMQAIGQAILRGNKGQRVVYISSEEFTNELIAAIQTRTTAKFRDRYRTIDVLMVDDIHFIAEKEATQEEFFHTFNALYDAHKQIIISSDRSPKAIAGLEERLVSRFEWGLVTDIQLPDLETRTAILRKKAEDAQVQVPTAVTDFIAQQVTTNIRELEGALIRVIAYSTLFNTPLREELAREVLKDMVREQRTRITLGFIQERVADYFKVEMSDLRGARRQRSILHPRQIAMFLCRKLTESSLPEIGRAFGGRDHTTVMHAVDKIQREAAQDTHKQQTLDYLEELILAASRTGV